MAAGQLELHYQPKIACRTSRVCGAEALARWTLADGSQVPPSEFITAAEIAGGIAELTIWGVERVLQDREQLRAMDIGGPFFVNLSGVLITDRFTDELLAVVGARAAEIGFEVTETAVIENPQEALRCLHRLRDHGLALAIDDYGAGLSSLNYLKQIPATELKIDRQFVTGMTRSNRDPLIVRSTIDLCHGLGLTVTAEGVENAMTASLLRIMGCDHIQGYYVAHPLRLNAFADFVTAHDGTDLTLPQIQKNIVKTVVG